MTYPLKNIAFRPQQGHYLCNLLFGNPGYQNKLVSGSHRLDDRGDLRGALVFAPHSLHQTQTAAAIEI